MRLIFLVMLTALLPLQASASTQTDARGRIPSWEQSHLETSNSAVLTLYYFAVCVKQRQRPLVEKAVDAAASSPEEEETFNILLQEKTCPGRTDKIRIRNPLMLKGAFAEALYNGDKRKPKSDTPLPTLGSPEGQIAEWGQTMSTPLQRGDLVSRWVADCAVRRAPRAAHSVLQYTPGAVGELRGLRALTPEFLACLPSGERLRASRLLIRALIAEALYRASRTSRELFHNA